MNKLFRATLKRHKWEHAKSLYVISQNKEEVAKWVNNNKRDGFEIYQIVYLGDEIAGCCFSPNINSKDKIK